MTIHFSPYYDAGVWSGEPAKGKCLMGEPYLGPLGLLDRLEQDLALTARTSSHHIVLKRWLDSLEQAMVGAHRFYGESLRTDRLGTAGRLLEWRDALVLCGWSDSFQMPEKLSPGARCILGDLAFVDRLFRATGTKTVSDRWRDVLDAIPPSSGIEPGVIVIDVPTSSLEPFWRELIERLCGAGWKVSSPDEVPALPEDVEILHFKDYVDACAWFANRDDSLLAITKDSYTLDFALGAVGKAYLSSETTASCHQLSHLFHNTLRMLGPANRDTFIGYLSISPHPLDQYKDAQGKNNLRFRLLSHILRQGGLGKDRKGESFNDIIKDFDISPEDRDLWIPIINQSQDQISINTALRLCCKLGDWAESHASALVAINGDPHTIQQLYQIKEACETLPELIESLGCEDKIQKTDYQRLLSHAEPAAPYVWFSAEVGGSPLAVGSRSIAAPCSKAVWLDCSADAPADVFPFLSPTDNEILHNGLSIPLRSESLAQADACCRASLSNVKRLQIAYCDKIAATVPDKHPILIEVAGKKADGGKVGEWLERLPYSWPLAEHMVESSFINANTEKEEYDLGEAYLSIPEIYSASSIELLLERPFDYVVRYVLNLYDESEDKLSTVQGTVAHLVINKLIHRAGGGIDKCTASELNKVFLHDFDGVFDESVMDAGLLLLLPENVLQLKDFRNRLQNVSLPALISILQESNLRIVGSEVPCSGELVCPGTTTRIRLGAVIDLLLQDENESYVIFDFKWHSRTNEEKKKGSISKGQDYQLVLYRALVEQGYVEGVAQGARVVDYSYYMLRSGVLYTDSVRFRPKGDIIEVVQRKKTFDQSLQDLFTQFDEAIQNLRSGIITVGKKEDYGENHILKGKLN